LKNDILNPIQMFNIYVKGIQNNVNDNTLGKNGLIYDYKLQQWVPDVYIQDYVPQNNDNHQLMSKLETLDHIKNEVVNDAVISMEMILVLANNDFEFNMIIRDPEFISIIKGYFEGLHQYQSRVFIFQEGIWIIVDKHATYATPQIHRELTDIIYPDQFLTTFMTIITNINTINHL
jgi:hypothetical protein